MNNASDNLDAAILADGVLWQAAEDAYQATLIACRDDDVSEAAADAAYDAMAAIRSRINGTAAKTPAGQAVKLAIFKSVEAASSPAEAAAARATQLAELIAGDDVETAAAYSLMLDFLAAATPSAASLAA